MSTSAPSQVIAEESKTYVKQASLIEQMGNISETLTQMEQVATNQFNMFSDIQNIAKGINTARAQQISSVEKAAALYGQVKGIGLGKTIGSEKTATLATLSSNARAIAADNISAAEGLKDIRIQIENELKLSEKKNTTSNRDQLIEKHEWRKDGMTNTSISDDEAERLGYEKITYYVDQNGNPATLQDGTSDFKDTTQMTDSEYLAYTQDLIGRGVISSNQLVTDALDDAKVLTEQQELIASMKTDNNTRVDKIESLLDQISGAGVTDQGYGLTGLRGQVAAQMSGLSSSASNSILNSADRYNQNVGTANSIMSSLGTNYNLNKEAIKVGEKASLNNIDLQISQMQQQDVQNVLGTFMNLAGLIFKFV